MKKLVKIKLNLSAGKAMPSPPIGPILGQYGIGIKLFCKEYNDKTEKYLGLRIPVTIIFSEPKKITLKLHTPPISFLVSLFAKNNWINVKGLKKILSIKKKEFYPISSKKCLHLIKGTLKSMRINTNIQE